MQVRRFRTTMAVNILVPGPETIPFNHGRAFGSVDSVSVD